jgi:hypothetical protein
MIYFPFFSDKCFFLLIQNFKGWRKNHEPVAPIYLFENECGTSNTPDKKQGANPIFFAILLKPN